MTQHTQYTALADRLVQYALKAGCQQARIVVSYIVETNVEARGNNIETLLQSTGIGVALNLFVDGRYGTASSNRLVEEELIALIDRTISTTRYLGEDLCRKLPDPTRYYRPQSADENEALLLGNCEETVATKDIDIKNGLVLQAAGEATRLTESDPRIISVEVGLQDRIGWQYISDSQGFKGKTTFSVASLYSSVALQDDDEARPSDFYVSTAIGYDTLKHTDIVGEAYRRALRKLGSRPIEAGHYTIVVDRRSIGKLLDPLLDAMDGGALYRERSFLAQHLDKPIASPLLTLTDQPHRHGALGARLFDFEGVATVPTTIVEAGVLKSFSIDTYYGEKLQTAPTFSGPSVLCVAPGERSQEEIIASQKRALLITGWVGGNHNEVTGDFSFGIEGVLIEDGVLTTPVSEMNITGNLLELWMHLSEVGNETDYVNAGYIPTLVFEEVKVG